jgi:protein-S-isoprenylcysteine O-methyltransferase Ste14
MEGRNENASFIDTEESALTDAFGQLHRLYMQRTERFLLRLRQR